MKMIKHTANLKILLLFLSYALIGHNCYSQKTNSIDFKDIKYVKVTMLPHSLLTRVSISTPERFENYSVKKRKNKIRISEELSFCFQNILAKKTIDIRTKCEVVFKDKTVKPIFFFMDTFSNIYYDNCIYKCNSDILSKFRKNSKDW